MEFKVGKRYIVADKTMLRHGNVIEITGVNDCFAKLRYEYKTIKEVHRDDNSVFHGDSRFAKSLKPLKNDCIVIYRKGDETIAINKTTGEKATAKCHQDDEYDFTTGAKLAFSRLVEPEQPKVQKVRDVKRRAKKGEYVKIVNKVFGINYTNGDIGEVVGFYKDTGYYKVKFIHLCEPVCIYPEECVVLEEFTPHLVNKDTGSNYGIMGTETPFKDAIGRTLRVGDTVELYNSRNDYRGERSIVQSYRDEQQFIMSIKGSRKKNENGETPHGFKIILKRRYEDIKHGEIVDDIKYIKER